MLIYALCKFHTVINLAFSLNSERLPYELPEKSMLFAALW